MGVNLFDGSDFDNADVSKIEIDKEFARTFEHNKKREDLQRYEELKKKGLIPRRVGGEDDDDSEESSSLDNDEEGDISVHSKKTDLEFFEVLITVSKQDPSLKSKDLKLLDSESDSDDQEGGNNGEEEEKKATYLKDVLAKHLIEEGPELRDKGGRRSGNILAYDKKQEEIRKAFLEAVEENEEEEDGDDLLRVKQENESDEDESDDEVLHKKLDEYFGGSHSGELDENANFLKEYFMNKMWIDKSNGKGAQGVEVGDEELEMLSEDEKEIEKQEEYEYRFQENAGDQILGHSREVEGTVRKQLKARKEQRKHKEERMEIARLEREEELRHLKNLKKKEIDERVRKIMETAGIRGDEIVPLSAKELEEEFDSEEHDNMMKKAFGKKYYDAEDVDPEFGSDADEDSEIEKPDFEKEDELLELRKGWDGSEIAARESVLDHRMENDGDDEGGEEQDEEEENEEEDGNGKETAKEVTEEGKRKRKRKLAILEKTKRPMLEEYYKLDYEDTIGDLKTRFKSRLTKIQDTEWKAPDSKRYQMKMKAKEVLRQVKPNERKIGKKKRERNDENKASWSDAASKNGKPQIEDSASDVSNLSRKAKRRQRQAELKLSHSRLMAYGKIESKPKKAKH